YLLGLRWRVHRLGPSVRTCTLHLPKAELGCDRSRHYPQVPLSHNRWIIPRPRRVHFTRAMSDTEAFFANLTLADRGVSPRPRCAVILSDTLSAVPVYL